MTFQDLITQYINGKKPVCIVEGKPIDIQDAASVLHRHGIAYIRWWDSDGMRMQLLVDPKYKVAAEYALSNKDGDE